MLTYSQLSRKERAQWKKKDINFVVNCFGFQLLHDYNLDANQITVVMQDFMHLHNAPVITYILK